MSETQEMSVIERAARAVEIAAVERTAHHPVRKELAKMEWKPIETAPKDGTRIILANHEWTEIGRWRHDYPVGDQQWMDDGNAGWKDPNWPTHWMPLPEPPQ